MKTCFMFMFVFFFNIFAQNDLIEKLMDTTQTLHHRSNFKGKTDKRALAVIGQDTFFVECDPNEIIDYKAEMTLFFFNNQLETYLFSLLKINEDNRSEHKIERELYTELFDKYGGRISYCKTRGGYYPIDAYKKWLKEREANGDFIILDIAFSNEFWLTFDGDVVKTYKKKNLNE